MRDFFTPDYAPLAAGKKRLIVHVAIMLVVSFWFWSFSRYPALIHEYERAEKGTLTERHLGKITKGELLKTQSLPQRGGYAVFNIIYRTTINWVDANKIGMSFGILFGGALLSLWLPYSLRKKLTGGKGLLGSMAGLVAGMPLGICANCVAPIGLSMWKKGLSLEFILSTMIASPTLNVVGAMMLFMLFPFSVAATKLAGIFILTLVLIPLIVKIWFQKDEPMPVLGETLKKPAVTQETWLVASKRAVMSFLHQTITLALLTVPLMLVASIIGASVITLFPLEGFLGIAKHPIFSIFLASVFGTFLPIPMLVDIILVEALVLAGLHIGIAATLLITMPTYSIFSAAIIAKYISWKLSAVLFFAVMMTGVIGGLLLTVLYGDASVREVLNPHAAFVNDIGSAGLTSRPTNGGANWVDYDGDGYLDIYTSDGYLYRNLHNGRFTDVTVKAGLPKKSGAAVFGDYDNDGCPDIYLSRHGSESTLDTPGDPDVLYHNDCDGTFTDVTGDAGVHDALHGFGAAWADYDGDGYLDIYVANWGVTSDVNDHQFQYKFEPNILYRNNRDGTFTDVTEKAGVLGNAQCETLRRSSNNSFFAMKVKPAYQPIWFDYDNDQKPDLFVANDTFLSPLYRNNGDGTFSDVTERAGLCRLGTGMGVTVGDYDGNGYQDIYVTNTGKNYLWHNNGDGTFSEVAEKVGVADTGQGWGTGFFDYDNDGDLDLYVVNGTSNPENLSEIGTSELKRNNLDALFRNNGDGTFTDVAQSEGIYGNEIKRGAAFGDYNRDGFTDIFVALHNMPEYPLNRLYRNKHRDNHWLTFRLLGVRSNRDAIGAKIFVTSAGQTQMREVVSGDSFLSQRSLWQTFGLGQATFADTVEIVWPSGIKQALHSVRADQNITVREAE